MKQITWLFAGAFLFAMTGCVAIQSSAISDSPNGVAGTSVHAEETGEYGILHLSEPKDLTIIADQALMGQCASGHLSNVQTQLSIRDWFLVVQVYTLRATAVCQ
jgi:hypothetical protein